ncbi:MAG: hypothetical protein VX737_04500 [Pseudomonadota bacterium]|nr:hypothetical protein [Pseudomonadota bacterium]
MRMYLLGFLTALLTAASANTLYRHPHHLRGSSLNNTTSQNNDSFYQEVVRASGMPKLGNRIERQLIILKENPNTEKALRELARDVVQRTKEALKNPHTLQNTFKDELLLANIAIASLYDKDAQSIFPFLKTLISSDQPISPHPIFGSPDMSNFRINRVSLSALNLWLTTKGKQQQSLKAICEKRGCNSPSKMAKILDSAIDPLDTKTLSRRNPVKSIKELIKRGLPHQNKSKKPR